MKETIQVDFFELSYGDRRTQYEETLRDLVSILHVDKVLQKAMKELGSPLMLFTPMPPRSGVRTGIEVKISHSGKICTRDLQSGADIEVFMAKENLAHVYECFEQAKLIPAQLQSAFQNEKARIMSQWNGLKLAGRLD